VITHREQSPHFRAEAVCDGIFLPLRIELQREPWHVGALEVITNLYKERFDFPSREVEARGEEGIQVNILGELWFGHAQRTGREARSENFLFKIASCRR
jgi:hypothetical protein